jgi:hypothetical protein
VVDAEEIRFGFSATGTLASIVVETHCAIPTHSITLFDVMLFACLFMVVSPDLFDLMFAVAFIPACIIDFGFVLILVWHSILSNTLSWITPGRR